MEATPKAVPPPPNKQRIIANIILAGLVCIPLYWMWTCEAPKEETTNASEVVEPKPQTPEEFRAQIQRELDNISKGFDNSPYDKTVASVQLELVLFAAWGDLILKSSYSSDEEAKKLGEKLKAKVAKLQQKEFPIMRARYAKAVAAAMWENDIYVKSVGKRSDYLEIRGGAFAANRNIKDVQEALHDNVKAFRFRQVRYRWYEGQDDYTYYDINVPKDDALVVL